jgi:RimJ/RimL family protein N-acetyltransferase
MLHEQQIPRETDPGTGLPIGPRVRDSRPAPRPERTALPGQYCRLEPLDPQRHGDALYAASTPPDAARRFRYLFEEPPASRREFDDWLARAAASEDPLVFAVVDLRTGRAEGRQTLMRITPEHRSIEIGSIYWGPAIARSRVATEANWLFARYVFQALGYRRYEWKCDALNAPSRRAAVRFGFSFEGLFRRAVIVKGRSRDTAWYAMIEEEWPALDAAYQQWLRADNFDAQGQQRLSLGTLTSAALEKLRAARSV